MFICLEDYSLWTHTVEYESEKKRWHEQYVIVTYCICYINIVGPKSMKLNHYEENKAVEMSTIFSNGSWRHKLIRQFVPFLQPFLSQACNRYLCLFAFKIISYEHILLSMRTRKSNGTTVCYRYLFYLL